MSARKRRSARRSTTAGHRDDTTAPVAEGTEEGTSGAATPAADVSAIEVAEPAESDTGDTDEATTDGDEAFDGFDEDLPASSRRTPDPDRGRSGTTDPSRKRRAASTRGRSATASAAKDPVRRPETGDPDASATQRAKRSAQAERTRTARRRVRAPRPNPVWLAPTAVILLILGLVYLVAFYLSGGSVPFPIGDWNLAVGFGIAVVGGALLMFWK